MKRYRDALDNLSTRNDRTDQMILAAIARDVKKSRAFHKKGVEASPNPIYPGPLKRMEYSAALWYLVSTKEGTLQCPFCEADFFDKSILSWLAHCRSAGCVPAEVQKKWMDQCDTSESEMKKIINNARWDCSFTEMRRRPSTTNGYECPECQQNMGTDAAYIHHVYDKHADDTQKVRMEIYWAYEKLFSPGPKGKIQSQVRSTSYGAIITASTIKGGKDGWRCVICAQQINGQADPCESGYDAQPFFLHMAKCVKTDAIDKWTVQRTQGQHLKFIDLRPIMALAEKPPPTRKLTLDTGDPWPETDGKRLFKALDSYNNEAALNVGQIDNGIVRFDSDRSGEKATGNSQGDVWTWIK